MERAIIFDMDGTLADVSGIRHLLPDFDAFHLASVDSPPHDWVARRARWCPTVGIAPVVVTARRARYRHVTAWWLAMHEIPSAALIMRADHDGRPDAVVKRDMLAQIRRSWHPILAYDDRPEVLAMWKEQGLTTLRVPGWR